MSEEAVTTPQAEPATATPTPEPKAEAKPEPKPEPDWQAAYKGLQTTVNKLHARDEAVARKESEVAESLRQIREMQTVMARQTLGPEQAARLEAQQRYQQERAAALAAAQTTEAAITAYGVVLIDALKTAGISPDDPDIDWARDTGNVQEWQSRVSSSVQKKIEAVIAKRISQAEEGIKAKSAAEIKAEAEALAARAVKEAGVDKIDTGKSGATSGGKSVAEMNDAEFAAYSDQKRQERERRRMQALR
jgi:hypothetical protein